MSFVPVCMTLYFFFLSFLYLLTYSVMDPETAAGQKPQEYAYAAVRSILREDNELIPLKFVPVIWLRALFPSIYFQIMKQRAIKLAARHNATHIV